MLGCTSCHATPWTRGTGEESGVNVSGLVEGEEVVLEFKEYNAEALYIVNLQDGFNPLDTPKIHSYRVRKQRANGGTTCVEICLNAK